MQPESRKEYSAAWNQLRAEAERLRIQFVDADLGIAMTFLRIASTACHNGETDEANRLIARAEHASHKVAEFLDRISEGPAGPLREKLATLDAAIAEAKKAL